MATLMIIANFMAIVITSQLSLAADSSAEVKKASEIAELPPGIYKIEHPGAAKGLIRINKDGSYQYRTDDMPKSQAASVRAASFTAPKIEGTSGITFDNMYGSVPFYGVLLGYDWQPFQKFGTLGLSTEMGFAMMKARGYLKNSGGRSEERYSLYMIPASLFVNYRFEYSRRQWIVPFIYGGGTYWGLIEQRDDGKKPSLAAAGAFGGGGGLHISITRWDHRTGFELARDFGVVDMWITLEGRAMQGASQEMDFTGQVVSAGITVDY